MARTTAVPGVRMRVGDHLDPEGGCELSASAVAARLAWAPAPDNEWATAESFRWGTARNRMPLKASVLQTMAFPAFASSRRTTSTSRSGSRTIFLRLSANAVAGITTSLNPFAGTRSIRRWS